MAAPLTRSYSNKSAWRRCDSALRTKSAGRMNGARLRDTSATDAVKTRCEDATTATRTTRATRNEFAAARTRHAVTIGARTSVMMDEMIGARTDAMISAKTSARTDATIDAMTEAKSVATDLSRLVVANDPSLALRRVLPANHVLHRVLAARALAAADKLHCNKRYIYQKLCTVRSIVTLESSLLVRWTAIGRGCECSVGRIGRDLIILRRIVLRWRVELFVVHVRQCVLYNGAAINQILCNIHIG